MKRHMEAVTLAEAQPANNGPRPPLAGCPDQLLTFDPGTHRSGISLFEEGYLVMARALVTTTADPVGLRVRQLGRLVQQFLEDMDKRSTGLKRKGLNKRAEVVVEFPQVYSKGPNAGKVNPRDINWIAAAVGCFLGQLPPFAAVHDVTPNDWKGQMDKESSNALVLESLYQEELDVLETTRKKRDGTIVYDDNMLDGAGLGLKHLKRMR